VANVQAASTVHTFSDLEFADGVALLAIMANNDNLSVKLTPTGGGATIEATRVFDEDKLDAWIAPITAGTYNVVITAVAWRGQTTMSYGTVQHSALTPVQVVSSQPLHQSAPHLTQALTVPANGLALVLFGAIAGSGSYVPPAANNPTVLIDEGSGDYQSTVIGLAIGSLAESGQGSFTFAFGSHARAGLVFAATG
jgi:hypothetical protein